MEVDISVIIPVYNTEKYLKQCLESVINQSYQNFEIVIVNDGSSDNSQKVINCFAKRYPDKIKCICQKNRGQSAARNAAIKIAQGKYFVFIDSDDFIGVDYIKTLYEEAESNHSDMVICNYTKVSSEGEVLKTFDANYVEGEMRIPTYLSPNRIIRSELFAKYNLQYKEGVICEDIPLILELEAIAKNIKVIPMADYYYRCNPKSTTLTFKKKKHRMDQLPFEALKECVQFCRNCEVPMNEEKLEFFICRIFTSLIFDLGRGCEQTVRKGMCKEVICFMDEYFPHYYKNKYVKLGTLKGLSRVQKWGTWVFVHVLHFRLLNLVSFVSSFI